MNRKLVKCISLLLLIVLLTTSLVSAMGCSKKDSFVMAMAVPLSGSASSSFLSLKEGFSVFCEYINAEDPIPGIELEVIEYDTKLDQSEAVAAYTWVREQGAKFLAWTDSTTALTNMESANLDKFPIFVCSGTSAVSANPGYVFCYAPEFGDQVEGFLKWVEDTWDYGTNGNPKIGFFGWSDHPVGQDHYNGAKDYSEASTKLDWVEGSAQISYMGTSTWTASQVDSVKDCDYLICGCLAGAAGNFINEYRGKGYDGQFVFTDSSESYWTIMAGLCSNGLTDLDDSIWISNGGYLRAETYPAITLLKQIIEDYGSDALNRMLTDHYSYGIEPVWIHFLYCVEMLREAVAAVDDPKDITGEQLYNIATSMEFTLEGYPDMGYTDTIRTLLIADKIFQYDATADDFSAISDDWVIFPDFE